MKRKIGTILLALSIATISLTACGNKTENGTAQVGVNNEINAGKEVVIEKLPWLPLSSLESYPELRKAFESELDITGTTGNKEGVIYYNTDTEKADQNVTLYMVLRNESVVGSFVVKGPMERFGEIASEHYADVEADDLTAPYAAINAYFELLPDQEEGQFDGDATISRAQAMALVMRATTPVNEEQAPETNADFTAKVGESKYTDFAAPMNDYAYINIENGLNEGVFNTAMSRGEYIYMITNLIYSDYKETLEANGYKDTWEPTSDITLSTVSNAGDIKFSEAISNASGVPSDMYDTLKLAVQYQLIPESILEDWDSSITKADALEIFISMTSNYSSGCGRSVSTSSYENLKVDREVDEVIAIAKELGYDLSAETAQSIVWNDWDPTDTGVLENLDTAEFIRELTGKEDVTQEDFQEWVRSQGADYAFGWTFIYEHGSAAGDQPSYGVYMKEGSPLYGKVFHVGEELPTGTPMPGTQQETIQADTDKVIKMAEEQGYEVEHKDGKVIIHID